MSLILALVLIVILLCKVGIDKSKDAAFDFEKSKRDKIISNWKNLYVDKDLEVRLERCIEDERNYAEVREEISKVLSNMEHWRYLLDGDFPLNDSQILGWPNQKRARETLGRNRRIALDILLANRGKVSMMASAFGYEAYVRNGSLDLKESAYEYAETILKLMRAKGHDVKLYYYGDTSEKYYWEGTQLYHCNDPSAGKIMLDFDREILFQRIPLPKIDS